MREALMAVSADFKFDGYSRNLRIYVLIYFKTTKVRTNILQY